jgi:uncharacterized protein with GYD domain
MIQYVLLIRFNGLVIYTESGGKMTKDIEARLVNTKVLIESIGATVVSSQITLGCYDAVIVAQLSDKMVSRMDQLIASAPARIEVLRALSAQDLGRVLALAS